MLTNEIISLVIFFSVLITGMMIFLLGMKFEKDRTIKKLTRLISASVILREQHDRLVQSSDLDAPIGRLNEHGEAATFFEELERFVKDPIKDEIKNCDG